MPTMETSTIAVTIEVPFEEVVSNLSNPLNHPTWAKEFFSGSVEEVADDVYRVSVPMMGGPTSFRIASTPEFGVIDLYLAPEGAPFGDPLPVRVIPNGSGADVLWTLSRPSGLPTPAWIAGVDAMRRELAALKLQLESK